MPTFKELIRNKNVANHPLLQGYRNLGKVRDAMNKHAQDLQGDLVDLLSSGPEKDNESRDINHMIREAAMLVRDVFSQFDIPVTPKFFYEAARDIKHARNDEQRVVGGSIIFGGEFRSITGVRKRATITVPISAGELVPPSIMEVDGVLHVIGQSTMDEVLGRNTSYYLPSIREHYQSPPLNRFEREMATEMRNSMGVQPRKNPGSYYLNQRNVEARRKQAAGPAPRMFKQVVEAMEKAEEDKLDTFPRTWTYVLHNYILNFVSTASKDAWEPHLINEGFCLNPYGKATNRGRRRAHKQAQGWDDDASWEFDDILNDPNSDSGSVQKLKEQIDPEVEKLIRKVTSDEWKWDTAQDIIKAHAPTDDFKSLGEDLQNEIGAPDQLSYMWTKAAEELYYIALGVEEDRRFSSGRRAAIDDPWTDPEAIAEYNKQQDERWSPAGQAYAVILENSELVDHLLNETGGNLDDVVDQLFDHYFDIDDFDTSVTEDDKGYQTYVDALKKYVNQKSGRRRAQNVKEDFEKEIEMEVEEPIKDLGVEQLFEDSESPEKEPKFYSETKTPIEMGDGVRLRKGPGGGKGFQGTIVEVDEAGDYLIIKSKGMEYRVTVDDIEPVPSTFKKMYM